MSAVVSIERAAAGELPGWSVVEPARRAHSARVASLMGEWAVRLGLPPTECDRWRAAGWLHDALRDADPAALRALVPPEFRELPDPLLHGPAAAARLRADGLGDRELLEAITYHTTGHPALGRLGRALFLADTLEPGRRFDPGWSAALRARLPESFDAVLIEVVANRIRYLLERQLPLRPETTAFWNSLLEGR